KSGRYLRRRVCPCRQPTPGCRAAERREHIPNTWATCLPKCNICSAPTPTCNGKHGTKTSVRLHFSAADRQIAHRCRLSITFAAMVSAKQNVQGVKEIRGSGRGSLLALLKPYKLLLGLLLLFTLLSNGINLLIPKLIQAGIDGYQAAEPAMRHIVLA